ncbi:hypothetical protein CPB83DRAFT_409637 [Crepidotus variabilis]|uniref:Uncharacterized protein n=1 Tax=Crepidotus variabilis TaxID=179855 RepID=A0A9P6JUU2_9AGAR|nr:hypothetical protein CPB83DRAFT_409637 [Crepidotus variabilis]
MSKKWATEAKPLASNPRPEDDQTDLPVGLVVNPQRPSVKRRRGRRRDKLASSSGQGIDAFTSAQDVSIVGSTFNLTTVHHYGPEGSKGLPSSRGSQSPSHDQSLPVPCLNEEKPYNAGDAASIPHRSDSSSSRIYYEQLLSKLRGVPLWLPGPNANLPIDYRLRGAHIGDVGTITEFGGFSFLFNVFEEADSEINQGSVPDGFKPLRWISNSAYMKGKGTGDLGVRFSDVEKHAVYESGSWIGSETVEEINVLDSVSSGGLTFQTRALEGAILAMPYGATSHDLTNRRLLQDYMSKNLEQWYIYANHERGRQARNGDIRLVYGCDKASSWGIATFKYEQGSGNLSGTHVAKRIHFKPAGSTSKSNTEIATAFTWSSMGGESGRVGPSDKVMKGLYAHLALNAEAFRHPVYGYDDVAIENQSVFLRTLNATLATSTWTKWMSEDIDSFHDETSDSQFRDGQDYDRGGAREGGGSSNSSNAEHFPGNGSSSWGSNIEHTMMEGQPLYPIHPSDVLNRSLLRQFPHAQMAITADADWISVLSHGDSLETASLLRLGFHRLHFERLLHHTHQIVEIDGVIRIDKKSVISLQEREESTFRPTWKRHPGFYKRDGDLRFLVKFDSHLDSCPKLILYHRQELLYSKFRGKCSRNRSSDFFPRRLEKSGRAALLLCFW